MIIYDTFQDDPAPGVLNDVPDETEPTEAELNDIRQVIGRVQARLARRAKTIRGSGASFTLPDPATVEHDQEEHT